MVDRGAGSSLTLLMLAVQLSRILYELAQAGVAHVEFCKVLTAEPFAVIVCGIYKEGIYTRWC